MGYELVVAGVTGDQYSVAVVEPLTIQIEALGAVSDTLVLLAGMVDFAYVMPVGP